MTQYFTSLIIVSALISLALAISYKGDTDVGVLKCALAVILLYVTVMPLLGAASNFDFESLKFDSGKYDFGDKNAADEITAEAFSRGIVLYVAEEFSLDESDISVRVYGFDPLNMKAEKITVSLSGGAVHADFRAIREKLRKNGFESCEVKIEK